MKRECSLGNITSGIQVDTQPQKIIYYVYQQLQNWRDDPRRQKVELERELNSQLCKYLDSQARDDFPMIRFNHEEPQMHYPQSVDLSASLVFNAQNHSIYDPVIVFEGKRLPAPSSSRKKEYVTGFKKKPNGGIQRFKLGIHGANLKVVAIIGYVQNNTLDHWFTKINEWIAQLACNKSIDLCIWYIKEKLKFVNKTPAERAQLISEHYRKNSKAGRNVKIYHLWIVMNE